MGAWLKRPRRQAKFQDVRPQTAINKTCKTSRAGGMPSTTGYLIWKNSRQATTLCASFRVLGGRGVSQICSAALPGSLVQYFTYMSNYMCVYEYYFPDWSSVFRRPYGVCDYTNSVI